ncbi:protein IQ-DOMAIN 31-like isoform X1 [Durio zibethinus]|uniref:Protein IQ-DOMAIN 31-like isoform X1 n=1 Tax=Durio zibethinus TaxID=66656 RepID=A0A6P6BIL8_DURZI|nr:protein IQ-DOMAIN 31-like isoform X1 [Durio zibethinus]XP_022776912.1 protein IQ-DOMAIN 31-like isoform X1 [Durio zibethinus]XP_022776913.1 protein IQ-DOMAIN 31-like isoform X1 [Durio zibethinus]XP_022776914.1 protein IQ-DOMAIN 31-like isoform X1 [Durio zibethinus]
MGKSPGKWIKTLLLGKKSSKSNLSKERKKLNSANKGEVLVSSKVTVSDLSVDPPSISAPILVSGARDIEDSEKGMPTQLPNDGVNISSSKAERNDAAISNFGNPEDPDRIRLDQAAAKAQAAFRGYLARRAFRTLKGIIRLQALIRGYLVRRQAVATLFCTWGIVKFQAAARGQKVRCSDIGIEVQEKHLRLLQGSKSSDSFRVTASSQVKNLSNNVFVKKLLASSPSVLPLRLQYGPEEPDSSWQWLQRWTRSHFWESPSQPIRSLASKSQTKGVENGQGKTKRSVRKLSNAKVENGSSRSISEHEKPKRGLRRVSGNSAADSVQEHPQNELEKVKRNLRKLSDSAKEVSDKSEVVNEKKRQTLKKTSTSDAPHVSEQESAVKMRDVTATLSKLSNLEADLKFSSEDASLDEPNVCPPVDLPPAENNGKIENILVTEELSSKDEQVSDESSKANQRRASFPAKIDNQENGLNNMPKVPSYMAPTESVKARLRGQGSPRFTLEVVEKNGLNGRYSLPSSTNSNRSSLSPHAQRLVQVAGKGAIHSDKSLSSSRNANDKVVKAEWRR